MKINELISDVDNLAASPTAKYLMRYMIRESYNCGIIDTKKGLIHKERIEQLLKIKANKIISDKINKN